MKKKKSQKVKMIAATENEVEKRDTVHELKPGPKMSSNNLPRRSNKAYDPASINIKITDEEGRQRFIPTESLASSKPQTSKRDEASE